MLESIIVEQYATYTGGPQTLGKLSKLNFVYGCNGVGKTTISRIVAMENRPPGCKVVWSSSPLRSLVYNRDFVARNLSQSHQIKGIFTLGQATTDVLQEVEQAKTKLDELQKQQDQLQRTLAGDGLQQGQLQKRTASQATFADECWTVKKNLDAQFRTAFKGSVASKIHFRDRVLQERKVNRATLQTLEHLEQQAASVFAEADGIEEPITLPDFYNLLLLERDEITGKIVVGRSDVDIAAMIVRLGNSDWVREGQTFFDANGELCPFCQQEVPGTLRSQLAAYFDETFTADTDRLKKLVTDYAATASALHHAIQAIVDRNSIRTDSAAVASLLKDLDAVWRTNLNALKAKQKEPSSRVTLESSAASGQRLIEMLELCNQDIERHNNLVRNRTAEQRKLTGEIWRYILDEAMQPILSRYEKEDGNFAAAITSLERQIATNDRAQLELRTSLRSLEKQITSVEPTVQDMNDVLASCGFTGFRLQTAQQAGFYRLVRDDGSAVEDSLSEGERSFVAFLYFYHLLAGSESEQDVIGDRIAIIDDPVSSLDSNVLFAVSSLIRSLYEPICDGSSRIKQLIVLTHNVYFHKEVTCHPPNKVKLHFWVVKKRRGVSTIERKDSNPVSSSYELLWQELQDTHLSAVTVQNTMRRILENYFKMTGNVDVNKLEGAFTAQDRQLFKSLFSWSNAGSHDVIDDLHASTDDFAVEQFQAIFRRVFNVSGHLAHYDMMMNRVK